MYSEVFCYLEKMHNLNVVIWIKINQIKLVIEKTLHLFLNLTPMPKSEHPWEHEHRGHRRSSLCDRLCVGSSNPEVDAASPGGVHHFGHPTPKCHSFHSKYFNVLRI